MIPLGSKVIIKPIISGEKKTEAGLILVEKRATLAKAVVVHPPTDIETKLKEGDLILYPSSAGTETEFMSEEFRIISYDDCWVILNR